jgi:hypothetical protein
MMLSQRLFHGRPFQFFQRGARGNLDFRSPRPIFVARTAAPGFCIGRFKQMSHGGAELTCVHRLYQTIAGA